MAMGDTNSVEFGQCAHLALAASCGEHPRHGTACHEPGGGGHSSVWAAVSGSVADAAGGGTRDGAVRRHLTRAVASSVLDEAFLTKTQTLECSEPSVLLRGIIACAMFDLDEAVVMHKLLSLKPALVALTGTGHELRA